MSNISPQSFINNDIKSYIIFQEQVILSQSSSYSALSSGALKYTNQDNQEIFTTDPVQSQHSFVQHLSPKDRDVQNSKINGIEI